MVDALSLFFRRAILKKVLLNLFELLVQKMAGITPQGSQFDERQYDAKMTELYDFLLYFIIYLMCVFILQRISL